MKESKKKKKQVYYATTREGGFLGELIGEETIKGNKYYRVRKTVNTTTGKREVDALVEAFTTNIFPKP
jgi:hypothetical protein